MEIFKNIKGYEGLYQISNYGRVKSLSKTQGFRDKEETFLKPSKSNFYYEVSLSKNNKRTYYLVHKLVGLHFIPNPDSKPQINHIDGNKFNNHVANLEWVTISENRLHSYKIGLESQKGERNAQSKLCPENIWKIRALADNYNHAQIAKMFHVSRSNITLIINKKTWAHI